MIYSTARQCAGLQGEEALSSSTRHPAAGGAGRAGRAGWGGAGHQAPVPLLPPGQAVRAARQGRHRTHLVDNQQNFRRVSFLYSCYYDFNLDLGAVDVDTKYYKKQNVKMQKRGQLKAGYPMLRGEDSGTMMFTILLSSSCEI